MGVKPYEVGDPRSMAVSGKENGVIDFVVVEVGERSVSVALIAVPCIIIDRVRVSIGKGLVESGENDLISNDAPCCASS